MPQAVGNSNCWPDLFEDLDRLGVRNAEELAVDDVLERFDDRLVDPLVEELHVFRAFFQHVAEDAFQQPFGQFHVAPQVAKGHLRLDHPELGQVAGRVAVLGAEGGAERVGLAQRAGERLGLELPADGQIGRPVEEVEREIDLASALSVRPLGTLFELERGDLEHGAGAFAIAGGDDRRVDVEEAALLEELVDRVADAVPHPGDGAEGVGARPQMGDRAQELERVALSSARDRCPTSAMPWTVTAVAWTSVACPLPGEAFTRPVTRDAAAGRKALDLRLVVRQAAFGDHLDVAEAGAVVDFQEAEAGLRVAAGADPAVEDHFAADRFGPAGVGNGDDLGHGATSCRFWAGFRSERGSVKVALIIAGSGWGTKPRATGERGDPRRTRRARRGESGAAGTVSREINAVGPAR